MRRAFLLRVMLDAYSSMPGWHRGHGGIGLGLTLACGPVEMNGASLEVDSETGIGSRFTLHLPAQEDP